MEMGEKIKMLREQNSMTLEELGNKVGVGKSTVRKWENGMIANMRRDKIAKLANALNCSPGYLMGWDQEEIKVVSEMQNDANDYDDSMEHALQNFMYELSEMNFEPSEMKRIIDYANAIKTSNNDSDELHKAFIDLFTKMYKLDLSIDDLNAIYTYAQMLKNNKKG